MRKCTNPLKHGGEMPYYILTYDISEERVNKVRKILKKYLNWVQNSVFEGEISEGKFEMCKKELEDVIKKEFDSIYIYKFEGKWSYEKKIIGVEKEMTSSIL